MSQKWNSDKIASVIEGSELETLIKSELSYKKRILEEFESLKKNLNFDSNSLYLLKLFLGFLRIPEQPQSSKEFIQNQLKTTLKAFQEIGTFESFVTLFRTFLQVEIDILLYNEKPSKLTIQMRDYPHFNLFQVILDPSAHYGFLVETAEQKHSRLAIGKSQYHFVDNFYKFVKTLVVAGVEIEIREPEGD